MSDEEDFEEIEIPNIAEEDGEHPQKEKKEEEISMKKKQAFLLSQAKDPSGENSIWGNFRIRSTDSLEIIEDEAYYRTPLTNIIEGEKEFQLFIELPGLDKKNVKITLQEGILEITGDKFKKDKDKKEKKEEKHKDKKDEKKHKDKDKKDKEKEKFKEIKGTFLRREFKSPSYYRAFHLPEDILSEEIDASFRNGILRLNILKKSAIEKETHVIDIK
jgi:HSP20 family protein